MAHCSALLSAWLTRIASGMPTEVDAIHRVLPKHQQKHYQSSLSMRKGTLWTGVPKISSWPQGSPWWHGLHTMAQQLSTSRLITVPCTESPPIQTTTNNTHKYNQTANNLPYGSNSTKITATWYQIQLITITTSMLLCISFINYGNRKILRT